jgi:hypothetical protein
MDKNAQQRGITNKLHDLIQFPARSAENFFKPELKRVMDQLINADDVIRSTLAGEKIGKATPEDKVSAKTLLKEARSFFNRREYMSAAANLGKFHKKMQDVVKVLEELKLNIDGIHHQFLFNKLPKEHYQQLEDLEKRFATARLEYFTKEGGLMDFFANIGTQRGRALGAWEKRYEKKVGPIKEGTLQQLESAEELLNEVLSTLKVMATARVTRNIDAYVEAGKNLAPVIKKFEAGGAKGGGFKDYYNNIVKPWWSDFRKSQLQPSPVMDPGDGKTIELATEPDKKQSVVPPNIPIDLARPGTQALNRLEEKYGPASGVPTPGNNPGFGYIPIPGTSNAPLPPPPNAPTNVEPPPTVPSLPPTSEGFTSDEVAKELFGPKKSSYDAFVDSLEVFANEDPSLLASHIAKYASSIQQEQPEMAVKLFKIAKSLRG